MEHVEWDLRTMALYHLEDYLCMEESLPAIWAEGSSGQRAKEPARYSREPNQAVPHTGKQACHLCMQ